MNYYLEDFLFTTRKAKHLQELFPAYYKFIQSLGFDRLAYAVISEHDALQTGHPLGMVKQENFNGWDDYYLDNNYAKIDPVANLTYHKQGIYHWAKIAEGRALTKQQTDFFLSVENDAELYHGASFATHGPSATKGVTLACTSAKREAPNPMAYEIANLAAYHFHLCYVSINKIQSEAISKLSTREADVVKWAAKGLTLPQIGDRLNISTHTVDYYMRSIKNKLKAPNTTAAVVIAIREGIIAS